MNLSFLGSHLQIRKLVAAQLLSQIGDKLLVMGLIWTVAEKFSAAWIPWILGLSAIPHILFFAKAPQWVQKFGSLKILIRTDFGRGIIYAVLAGLLMTGIVSAEDGNGHLFLFTVIVANLLAHFLAALFNTAIFVYPTEEIKNEKDLNQATSLIESCFTLSNVIGPALGAILFKWLGLGGLALFNAATYWVAGALEASIRAPQKTESGQSSATDSTASAPASVLQVLHDDSLAGLVLGCFLFLNLFLTPILVLLPLFVKTVYHGSISTLSGLEFSFGVGAVLGSLIASQFSPTIALMTRIRGGSALVAVFYLLFAFSKSFELGASTLFFLGVALSIVNVSLIFFFQTRPNQSLIPAIMSWVNLITVAALPVSMIISGYLLQVISATELAVYSSLGLAAVTLALTFVLSLLPAAGVSSNPQSTEVTP